MLDAGAILFSVLLVSMEIRLAMGAKELWTSNYGLAEQSLDTIAWLAMAGGLFGVNRQSGQSVRHGAGLILLALATLQAVLLQACTQNPWITGAPVGDRPVVNLLLLTFALPAALYGWHARMAPPGSPRRPWCGRLALVFAALWLMLEVRHSFAGSDLAGAVTSNAETYAYSLAGLAYAVAVLGLGIRSGSVALRQWGLGTLVLVVAKVFLVDMSHLTGIWRALSFLGLGAALIGVGGIYRRYVRISPP